MSLYNAKTPLPLSGQKHIYSSIKASLAIYLSKNMKR